MFIICLLLAQLLQPASARVFETDLKFSVFHLNKGWVFLDKMTFDRGRAEFTLETWVDGTPHEPLEPLQVWLVSDQEWIHEHHFKCQSQLKRAFQHTLQTGTPPATTVYEVALSEQRVYYIVVKDCLKLNEKHYLNPSLSIRIRLTMLNSGSHLSQDEDDDWLIMPLALCVAVWLCMRTHKRLVKGQDQDWAKGLLLLSIVLNLCALIAKIIGWLVYARSGVDVGLLSILYLLCHSLSESVVIGLLVLLAFGWTISFLAGEELDIYAPMAVVIGCLNCVMSIMTKLNDNSSDKYHMYDSLPGGMMVGMRIVALGTFLIGVCLTWTKSSSDKKSFLWRWGLCGVFYISSMPLLLLIGELLIDEKQQKQFMFLMVELIKVATSILLTSMITSSRSHYNKINLRNYSFLPSSDKLF